MNLILYSMFLAISSLQTYNIDIVANFGCDDLCEESKTNPKSSLNINTWTISFDQYLESFYKENIYKVVLMNDIANVYQLSKIPKEKLILFLWEPGGAPSSYFANFSQVYTYNDDLVDNIKVFKYHYPFLQPMIKNLTRFEDKKLCVMVSHSYTKERVKMIKYFETKPDDEFDYYAFTPMINTPRYRGSIPGNPISREKFSIMNQYRFAVCFENSHINGYITEKIFACFAAGCVPIYFGAPNIEDYIPKDCFIDYRDFSNEDQLYEYISTMSKEAHNSYIENIKKYLVSEKAFPFTTKRFNELLLELTLR